MNIERNLQALMKAVTAQYAENGFKFQDIKRFEENVSYHNIYRREVAWVSSLAKILGCSQKTGVLDRFATGVDDLAEL
ncbi:hypothetical protein [Tardiphaga sp. P9-11]|jgi:hypothetical protein|uniref:hypothetical protein n=1 Tax=Tardiphaga sp. P9-11 TaxID=2024614 RepID=UPI0011F0D33C|nr:hypothetical protein [Tardiphaga sp. P9-11]KAA0072948.1 hypothetical protein CIW50_22345 [Tardiphaga sp. P9-11]